MSKLQVAVPWVSTGPDGNCSSVSGRAIAAAFDHDIHGWAASVGLWNRTLDGQRGRVSDIDSEGV